MHGMSLGGRAREAPLAAIGGEVDVARRPDAAIITLPSLANGLVAGDTGCCGLILA
ncbi:uncharacterized protein CIMG_01818 [Coccidioides immitis RS]|uniref:Uncharacterized protein n=1 Tax=Coccidioides immitis (strain RS) TaxID=246410 RepID=J3KK01_COCIM|nr:uncharacterized protein CIMG_01818 [Coccidioides immitis RS]EAS36464.3 hypothetical protein CIMG_01818 [Coccidioides immitis RS]